MFNDSVLGSGSLLRCTSPEFEPNSESRGGSGTNVGWGTNGVGFSLLECLVMVWGGKEVGL